MIAFGVGTVWTLEAISSGVGRPPPSTVQTSLATRWASALGDPASTTLARTSSIALRAHTLVRITVLPPHGDGRPPGVAKTSNLVRFPRGWAVPVTPAAGPISKG